MKNINSNQNGSIIIAVLIMAIVVSSIAIGFLFTTKASVKTAADARRKAESRYLCELVLKKVALRIKKLATLSRNIHVLAGPGDKSPVPLQYDEIPIIEPYEFFNYIYKKCIPSQSLKGSELTYIEKEFACQYQAAKYEVEQEMVSRDPRYNFKLTSFDSTTDKNEAYFELSKTTVSKNNPEYGHKWADQRIYRFSVSADGSRSGNASTSLMAVVVLFDMPLFQWLVLSNYTITIMSDTQYEFKGHIHSNDQIRLGTENINNTMEVKLFKTGNGINPSISTSGNFWHIFSASKSAKGSIKVFWDASPDTFALYEAHSFDLLSELLSRNSNIYDFCSNNPESSPLCWQDISPKHGAIYSAKIDNYTSDFGNALADHSRKVYPAFYEILNNYLNISPKEIILPGETSDTEILRKIKKWYGADIRLAVRQDRGIQIVDDNKNRDGGSIIPKDSELGGILKYKRYNFFEPRKNEVANVLELDVKAFINSLPKNKHDAHLYFYEDDADGFFDIDVSSSYQNPKTQTKFNKSRFEALMLVNGLELLHDKALTITSDIPVYVKGDYNITERPAAINADSITYLSNDWNPAKWYHPKRNPRSKYGWDPDYPERPTAGKDRCPL